MTWWKWLLAGAVGGVLIGWYIRTPVVRVEETKKKAAVITVDDNKRIAAGPGAKTTFTRSADGTERIEVEGPVVIDTVTRVSASQTEESTRKESKCPEWPKYAILGGVNLGMDGSMSNGILVGTRLVGPFWGYCGGFFPPVRGVVMVGVSF